MKHPTEVPVDPVVPSVPALLGRPSQGDGTCRGGYGIPVVERYGSACAYCGRDLAESYDAWLNLSVDHVVPRNAIAVGVPEEWIEDLLNHVTCCRACNEFLNGLRVEVSAPDTLEGFLALRDSILDDKRRRAMERHTVERGRYEKWRAQGTEAVPETSASDSGPRAAVGPLWRIMNDRPRRSAESLTGATVPKSPGVYCWYRDGAPQYSGRAIGEEGLYGRVWKNHLRTGPDLSRSSFRRNVCAHLGIAPTSVTTQRPTVMTPERVGPVNDWIRACEVAWIEFETEAEARDFERDLHTEWLPPLSRR